MFEERPINAFEDAVQSLERGSDPLLFAMENRLVEDLHLAGRCRQTGNVDEFVLHAGLDLLGQTFERFDEGLHIPGLYLRPIQIHRRPALLEVLAQVKPRRSAKELSDVEVVRRHARFESYFLVTILACPRLLPHAPASPGARPAHLRTADNNSHPSRVASDGFVSEGSMATRQEPIGPIQECPIRAIGLAA